MPEISRFFGTIITVNYNDHAPPHFHVRYGGEKALIDMESLTVLEGRIPHRVLGFVVEWASIHRDELLQDWRLARQQSELIRIAPLE